MIALPGAVAVKPAGRRVRVIATSTWVGDSDDAVLLFEHGCTPTRYLPAGDVRSDLLHLNGRTTDTTGRGLARWYDLPVKDRVIVVPSWDHPSPPP